MEKLYNENVIANEQGELFLAEKTFSVMSLFEQKEMMRRMLFEISGHRKDISLVHVEQLLALMANKEGKQQNCPYGVLARRVRDGLLLMKLSTDVTFSDKNKQKDGQQKSDEQNLENLNKKNKKCGNHSEDKMQPVYLPLTAESEESKAEETIVLSNETLLQKFTIHFSILPWNGGKVAKRDCVKYFDYDKMKCKPCLRTRDTGDYFIMDLSAAHAYFGDDACEMVNLLFYPWIIDPTLSGCEHLSQLVSHFLIQYLPKNLSSFSDRIFHDTHRRIRQLIEEIAKELYFRQPGFQAVVRAQMIRLIVEIMRRMGEKQQRSYSRITQDVIAVIERRYASALTLREVAARLGYSPAYLSRRFHADVGQSFIDYLQRFRLEMACHLLTTGKKSVAEIAAMVGYQDVRFFYQLFKRTYQCTPSTYRRNNRIDQKPQG